MSLVNNSANNFKDFLDAIKPYLNYQFYDMSGQGVEANNFSTDEKVIGTWIDGKPLYQKVLTKTLSSYTNTQTVDIIDISDVSIDKIVKIDTTFIGVYSTKDTASIISIGGSNNSNRLYTEANYSSGTYHINIYNNGRTTFNGGTAYVILKYTKTTDTAVASGEKIVGQWIDGKPVYEKTWSFGSKVSISNANWTDTPISSSGIERIVYACGYNLGTANDKGFYPLNAMNENSYVQCLSCRDGSNAPCAYILLRYTKTS